MEFEIPARILEVVFEAVSLDFERTSLEFTPSENFIVPTAFWMKYSAFKKFGPVLT